MDAHLQFARSVRISLVLVPCQCAPPGSSAVGHLSPEQGCIAYGWSTPNSGRDYYGNQATKRTNVLGEFARASSAQPAATSSLRAEAASRPSDRRMTSLRLIPSTSAAWSNASIRRSGRITSTARLGGNFAFPATVSLLKPPGIHGSHALNFTVIGTGVGTRRGEGKEEEALQRQGVP